MSDPRHTVVVGALVRDPSGNVLLIRSPKRGWEIPQGRVEEGEDLTSALRREVREETGIEAEPGPLAAVYSQLSLSPAVIFTFLANYLSGSPTPSEESPEVRWLAPDDALLLVTHPVNLERLRTLLTFSGNVVYRSYACGPYRVLGETLLSEAAGSS
jgi:8-oxo-dGTP diphosphatase